MISEAVVELFTSSVTPLNNERQREQGGTHGEQSIDLYARAAICESRSLLSLWIPWVVPGVVL